MPRALVAAGALLLLLSHSPAIAQAPTAEARGLFEAGIAAYDAGRYVDALEHFARCYDLTGEPALLYNMARAAEEAGRLEEALAHYDAYRARAPAAAGDDVEVRVAALRAALGRTAEPPSPPPDPPVERPTEARPPAVVARAAEVRPPDAHDPGPAAWFLVAGGAAAALAGGVLLGPWAAASDAVTGAESVDWSSVRGDYDAANAYSTAAALLLSIGGAALAAGLVWVAVEAARGDVAVGLGPGGAQARVRF